MGKESSKRASRTRSSSSKRTTRDKSSRSRRQQRTTDVATKKSVSFFETIRIQETFALHELSTVEIGQVWYSPEEIRRIRRRDFRLQMSLHEMPEEDRDILMNVYGIHLNRGNQDDRQIRIATLRGSVLVQQERLWEEEIEKALKAKFSVGAPIADPVAIAATSLALSREARDEAAARGLEVCKQVMYDLRRDLMSAATRDYYRHSEDRLVQPWLVQALRLLQGEAVASGSGEHGQRTESNSKRKSRTIRSKQGRTSGGTSSKRTERQAAANVKKMLEENDEDLTSATEDVSESSSSSFTPSDKAVNDSSSEQGKPYIEDRAHRKLNALRGSK